MDRNPTFRFDENWVTFRLCTLYKHTYMHKITILVKKHFLGLIKVPLFGFTVPVSSSCSPLTQTVCIIQLAIFAGNPPSLLIADYVYYICITQIAGIPPDRDWVQWHSSCLCITLSCVIDRWHCIYNNNQPHTIYASTVPQHFMVDASAFLATTAFYAGSCKVEIRIRGYQRTDLSRPVKMTRHGL